MLRHQRGVRRPATLFPLSEPRLSGHVQNDERSIFSLIDEYEDEDEPVVAAPIETERVEQEPEQPPVVDVEEATDGERNHNPRAHACPCKRCRSQKQKAETEDDEGIYKGVHETLLKCAICFGPTTEGGDHHPHTTRCGHIFGQRCIKKWLSAKLPSTCPICNKFTFELDLIKMHGSSSQNDVVEDALRRAAKVDILEENHQAETKKNQELFDFLFECLKRTGEALQAERKKHRVS